MKQVLFAALALCGLGAINTGCHSGGGSTASDTTYTVTGTLRGVDSGWAYLFYMKDGKSFKDSAKVQSGRFTFTGATAYPTFASVSLADAHGYPASFFLENTTITLSASPDSLKDAKVSGGAVETEYLQFVADTKVFDDKEHVLDSTYEAAEGNKTITDSLDKQFNTLSDARNAFVKGYIKAHPASYVSAMEIEQLFSYNPKVSEFDSAYSLLDSSIKQSPVGHRIADMLATDKKTDVGQVAPDFTLNDVNGAPVSLSGYAKGKVVLVDFWASWCGPCRGENPNVVKAFNAYKGKGFTVLGVSLDDKKEAWIKAIGDDHLAWGQVSDLKGWSSDVAALYGIRGIPMNFLLDKDGKIVAKGLRGDALDQQLASLLH